MIYTLDTEFMEDGITIDLLSIGLVAEDGREYYAQNAWALRENANEWVQRHVIPQLAHRDCQQLRDEGVSVYCDPPECPWRPPDLIASEIVAFCDPEKYGRPEFWTYYGAYDWVALCQLFGSMMDLPEGWPMLSYDLRQALDERGEQGRATKQPDDAPHHALLDARWIRDTLVAWGYALPAGALRRGP